MTKPGYKQTELGEIPAEWDVSTLGNPKVSQEIYYGITAKATDTNTGKKILRTTDICDYDFNPLSLPFCDIRDSGRDLKKYTLRRGDLVVARAGTVGVSVLVKNDLPDTVFGSYLIKVRPAASVIPRFVHYYMQSPLYWKHIGLVQGSTLANLNLPLLRSLPLPIPPIAEQNRIAEILGAVDDAIQKTDEVIAATERLKKGLMQRLLTRGIGHTRFKKTEIGEIPAEWDVARLSEPRVIFFARAGGTPSVTESQYWEGGTIPFVKIEDITKSGKYLSKTETHITEAGLRNSSAWLVPPGRVLLSMYASIGEATINTIPVATNQAIIALEPNQTALTVEFLFHCLQGLKGNWAKFIRQGTQKNLNSQVVGEFIIPLPPIGEQRKIAEILGAVDEKLQVEKRQREALERLKRGLMQVLLTGKVRVKV